MLEYMKNHEDIFVCPRCNGQIQVEDGIICRGCKMRYKVDGGIPLLFDSNKTNQGGQDVIEKVKRFYEITPFPNYEECEKIVDLIHKAEEGVFARLLNEQIHFNARVLEVGCGTGQLTNYLGIAQRFLFGIDMCINSLKLAENFRKNNNLNRVGFYQMNLFKPIFKEESFDFVICNGVLHHTDDPYGGFQSISRLVKKGGYILVGLYNSYGRIFTNLRRHIFNRFGERYVFLDSRLRKQDVGETRKLTWFRDQYQNPHESTHTIGEVIKWFNNNGFEFTYGIPSPKASEHFSADDMIFKKHDQGNWLDHFVIQSRFIISGSREGGLFIIIGRKVI